MWTVSQIICLGSLAGLSVTDIYYRKVPGEILAMGVAGTFIYQLCCRSISLWILAGGIGVGVLFLLASRVTREGIGYGDSAAILILGAYMGLWELLKVLSGTFLLLFAASAAGLCTKKMSRKYALPMFPFLTAGYLLRLLTQA